MTYRIQTHVRGMTAAILATALAAGARDGAGHRGTARLGRWPVGR